MSEAIEEGVTLEIWIRADALPRLNELARAADMEATGGSHDTYPPADAFALAFNDANRCAEAMSCLEGWSCIPAEGFALTITDETRGE